MQYYWTVTVIGEPDPVRPGAPAILARRGREQRRPWAPWLGATPRSNFFGLKPLPPLTWVSSQRLTGAAAGRDFLRNHNHTRGVRWLGRSLLPTDFPDPDRPCERNPGPPTGVSSLTMARARKKSHARFGLTPGGQDRRPGQGRDGEARARLLPRSGEPHADAAAH